jgi:hypothetical protein
MFDPDIFDHNIFETFIQRVIGKLKVAETFLLNIMKTPTIKASLEVSETISGSLKIEEA